MDGYDISEVNEPPKQKKPAGWAWNILTIVVLITTLIIGVLFLIVYINPDSRMNPFPPATYGPLFSTGTATTTPQIILMATWTPASEASFATGTPSEVYAATATDVPVDTATAEPAILTAAAKEYAFVVREGSPAAIDGAQFHPDADCKWSGVAGQATSLNGEAVKGLFVLLGGSLPGMNSAENITMTGLAPQYGQAGFEITLSDKPIASSGTLWIQLMDQQNLPLSTRVYFDTYGDCTKNLVIIYFDQVR